MLQGKERADVADELAEAIYHANPQIHSVEPGLIVTKSYNECNDSHKLVAQSQAANCMSIIDRLTIKYENRIRFLEYALREERLF